MSELHAQLSALSIEASQTREDANSAMCELQRELEGQAAAREAVMRAEVESLRRQLIEESEAAARRAEEREQVGAQG